MAQCRIRCLSYKQGQIRYTYLSNERHSDYKKLINLNDRFASPALTKKFFQACQDNEKNHTFLWSAGKYTLACKEV